MPLVAPLPVTVVIDRDDDVVHTHTALAAHHPPSGQITLHPGPGTTSETGLAHNLLAALGKPPLLPGRFPGGRQSAWEAATAWITALPVTRLTVLRAHRLTARRAMRLLQLRTLTGIRLTLVCHRPYLPAALHQALQTADHILTTDIQAARCHYYGTLAAEPRPRTSPPGRQIGGSPCPHWTASSPTTALLPVDRLEASGTRCGRHPPTGSTRLQASEAWVRSAGSGQIALAMVVPLQQRPRRNGPR
ncbi:hypothetical protein [Streptomyces sp. WAC 01529]|uniref:hypothetical protein n=1 Tax=Streptomyces sp. WAC 01529 TaxID=2203205 RepID=UPI001F0CBC5C|nr:hypothetical protein [Streptomyces sp. WAC 01529]